MIRRKTIVPLLLLPVLLATCLPAWAEEAEEPYETIKIIHPDGKDAQAFVRSRHVALGKVGDIEEKDGVLICDLHHPHYNFTYGGAFIEKFKIIKPADDQALTGFDKYKEIMLIKRKDKPDHWVVAGVQTPFPEDLNQEKPDNFLPATFLKNRMRDEIFYQSEYRYEGFVDENLEQLQDEDPTVRSWAMVRLSVLEADDANAQRVIDTVAKLMDSKTQRDRSAAISMIGDIGGEHAEPYVPKIALLLDSKIKMRADEQREAMRAICQIGGREAQKHLPTIAELGKTFAGFTNAAFYSLGEMGIEAGPAIPAIIEALETVDTSNRDYPDIIRALGKIAPDDPRVIGALTPLLNHQSKQIRWFAKEALDGKFLKQPDPWNDGEGIS